MSRLLPFLNKEPQEAALISPASADFQLMLAQMRRDHGLLSDKEMARWEIKTEPMARQSRRMFNPFTGEMKQEWEVFG